jgi:NAD(P)-dependent dehydrogenase (short-subunit alcohol dehydrogenase family)
MDLGLTNKVAIITGGSEGIGKAAAQRMAEEGARVLIVARRAEVLEAAAKSIQPATGDGTVVPVQGDVTETATIDRVVQTALDRFGRIDILVNNAGVSMAKPFVDVTDEDWENDFSLKVWAAVRLMRKVIPHMREAGGGRIINVTNLGGRTPGPSSMPTSISRAAGMAITKGMSKDLAKDNILVNTVCIGLIKSGQHERRYDRMKASNPDLTMDSFYADAA